MALLPTNTLQSLRFGAVTNGRSEAGGQSVTGSFSLALPPGTTAYRLVVRRLTPGQAVTVPLVVVDACDDWSTFVVGGAGAF